MKCITLLIAAITASVTCTSGFEAWAAGPTVTNPVAVITNDSANDSNFATGLFIYFQAFNGSDTSNQTAPVITTSPTFSSTAYGYVSTSAIGGGCGTTATCESLFTKPEPTHPNEIAASVPYSTALTGPFTFHVSSTQNFATGTNTSVSTTGSLAGIGAVPFVGGMTITPGASPLSPTISWTAPTTTPNTNDPNPAPTITEATVVVLNDSAPVQRYNINPGSTDAVTPFGTSFQQAGITYTSPEISTSPTANSFTLPTTNNNPNNVNQGSPVLQYGQSYTIGIQLQSTSGPAVPGCQLCNVVSRSDSFFDYTPIQPGSIPNLPLNAVINLPSTQPVPTTSGLFAAPVYSFNVSNVGPSSVTYIDPEAAYGFLYQIGAGNPNFASVNAITDVGTGIYQLLVWNGTQFVLVDSTLAAGQTFSFLTDGYADGVAEFEIIGIDPGVDPTDITAFITGLTYTSDGSFTGTMTPLVETTTPLPASSYLALTGLCGLGLLLYRSKHRRHQASIAVS